MLAPAAAADAEHNHKTIESYHKRVGLSAFPFVFEEDMKVTFFGTTTLLFDDGRDQLLFDAHFTRPSLFCYLFGKIRTDEALIDDLLSDHDMSRLRAIFVSHSHHDHVMDAPYIANRFQADIYGSKSTLNVARGGEVPEDRLHLFDPGCPVQVGDFSICVIPSIHSKPHFYNNDLGQMIDRPVVQPATRRDYKEGGSYDFLVSHSGKNYLIRPSFNYLDGQLDGIRADVAFLGITAISKESETFRNRFFEQTVEKVGAKVLIPLHWDNFFRPLTKSIRSLPRISDNLKASFSCVTEYCQKSGVECIIQQPLMTIEL